jgi:hypothetical protein
MFFPTERMRAKYTNISGWVKQENTNILLVAEDGA